MDLNKLMQQAQQMQAQMQQAQEKLATERVEATAGGGMVTVSASGTGEILSIKVDPEAVDPEDVEMLEDMVLAAVNEAHRMANDLAQQRMNTVMPGGLGALGL